MNAAIRKEAMRIAGEKVSGDSVIDVHYPYDNSVVGTVPKATIADVRRAYDKAAGYNAKLSRADRSAILRKAADALVARRDEIARLITLESGLCLKDSTYEVGRAYDVFTLAANACVFDDGQIFSCDITPHGKKRRIYTQRDSLTAITAITPFNHPLNQVAHKVAPSIATNNKMVLKPSEKTPLTALLLADVLYDAGLPPEMFQVITGDPREIADEIANGLLELRSKCGIDVEILVGEIKPGLVIRSEQMALDVGQHFPKGTAYAVVWGTLSPRTVGKFRPHVTCAIKVDDDRGLSRSYTIDPESQPLPLGETTEAQRRDQHRHLVACRLRDRDGRQGLAERRQCDLVARPHRRGQCGLQLLLQWFGVLAHPCLQELAPG